MALSVGFVGLLDFVGYPVAQGIRKPHGGFKGAGKRIYYQMMLEQAARRPYRWPIEALRSMQTRSILDRMEKRLTRNAEDDLAMVLSL